MIISLILGCLCSLDTILMILALHYSSIHLYCVCICLSCITLMFWLIRGFIDKFLDSIKNNRTIKNKYVNLTFSQFLTLYEAAPEKWDLLNCLENLDFPKYEGESIYLKKSDLIKVAKIEFDRQIKKSKIEIEQGYYLELTNDKYCCSILQHSSLKDMKQQFLENPDMFYFCEIKEGFTESDYLRKSLGRFSFYKQSPEYDYALVLFDGGLAENDEFLEFCGQTSHFSKNAAEKRIQKCENEKQVKTLNCMADDLEKYRKELDAQNSAEIKKSAEIVKTGINAESC